MKMIDMIALEAMKLIAKNQELILIEGISILELKPDPDGDFVIDGSEAIYVGDIDSTSVRYSFRSTYETIAKHAYMLADKMMIESEEYNHQ